jgi:hypothetical protein
MHNKLWVMEWDTACRSRLLDAPSPSPTEDLGYTINWRIGTPIVHEHLFSRVIEPGRTVDIEFAFPMALVVSESVKSVLLSEENLNVEFVPVSIAGEPREKFAVNVLSVVSCFDFERSTYTPYRADDEPVKAGMPEYVLELKVDPRLAPATPLFRVAESDFDIVVSDEVKTLLERARFVGASFVEA